MAVFQQRHRVFVSYSHKDIEWLFRLREALAPLIRNDRVDYWDDGQLEPGDKFRNEISAAIDSARVAVLLVSPHFLESSFIMDEELPLIDAAEADGLTVIWVPIFGIFYGPEAHAQAVKVAGRHAAFDVEHPLRDCDETERNCRLFDVAKMIQTIVGPRRVPSNLPFPSLGELFEGREQELKDLEDRLSRYATTVNVHPLTINGIGGIGKTRLAIEYATRNAGRFSALLFVTANTGEELDANLAGLCAPDALDLPEYKLSNQKEQFAAVVRWLQNDANSNWLLILDNVDTEEGAKAVRKLAPRLRRGNLIITSRLANLGTPQGRLSLDVIIVSDAARFLMKATSGRRREEADDDQSAMALAEALGSLPLALTHAAAYIGYLNESFRKYLDEFRRIPKDILEFHDSVSIEYDTRNDDAYEAKTIATTFFMSFDRLGPVEKAVLKASAFLAPDQIPVSLFQDCPEELSDLVGLWVEESGDDGRRNPFRIALAELAKYSLVTQSGDMYYMHRMVQLVLRTYTSKSMTLKWITSVRKLLGRYIPGEISENPATWKINAPLRPHVEELIRQAKENIEVEQDLDLIGWLAAFYYGKGQYQRSLALEQEALRLAEQTFVPGDPALVLRSICYGENLRVMEQFDEARVAFDSALAMCTQFRSKHVQREGLPKCFLGLVGHSSGNLIGTWELYHAGSLVGLAMIADDLGDPTHAKVLYEKAMAILEEELPPEHLDIAHVCCNLGWTEMNLTHLDSAQHLLERALSIQRRQLSANDPAIAGTLIILGLVERGLGNLTVAKQLTEEGVLIREQVLPPNHPDLALGYNDLGFILYGLGDFARARDLFRKATAIKEEVLPPDHSQLAVSYSALGMAEQSLGNLPEAESMLRRSVSIRRKGHRAGNSALANGLVNLSLVLLDEGKTSEAETYALEAREIWAQSNRREDSRLGKVYWVLGAIEARRGSRNTATAHLNEAIRLLRLGNSEDHPWVQSVKKELASLQVTESVVAIETQEVALVAEREWPTKQ